jgi:hypothetical protein
MKDHEALRQRKGYVVETIHTLELQDKELIVSVLSTKQDFPISDRLFVAQDFADLHDFALFVFGKLRARLDWNAHFESLEVGVRMDIGFLVKGSSYHFFVNEVTRIYSADFFANWLAEPGTGTCRAVAKALEDVFVSNV